MRSRTNVSSSETHRCFHGAEVHVRPNGIEIVVDDVLERGIEVDLYVVRRKERRLRNATIRAFNFIVLRKGQ